MYAAISLQHNVLLREAITRGNYTLEDPYRLLTSLPGH